MRKLMTLAGASAVALALIVAPSAVASAPNAAAAAKSCKKEKKAVKRADSKKETRKAKKALRKCRKANRPTPAPEPAPTPTPPPAPAPAPIETVLSKERARELTDVYAKALFDQAVATAKTPDDTPVRYQTEAPDTCDRIDDRTVDCSFGLYYVSSIPSLAGREMICVNMHKVMLLADGTIEEENDVLGCQ